MAKDFSFPFFVNNWMGGTMYFTFEQKGAYLELLLLQFNHGKFTEPQAKQVLNTCFSSVWSTIREKFITDGTYFWNEKMAVVAEERRLFVESRRNNRLGKIKQTLDEHLINTSETHEQRVESEYESEVISNDKNKILNRKTTFSESLKPFLEKYGKEMLNSFFSYWTEMNPGGKKMRFEMEKVFEVKKRLSTWKRNGEKFKSNGTATTAKKSYRGDGIIDPKADLSEPL